jgi:cytochrome c-type biogenesis protein CcmE
MKKLKYIIGIVIIIICIILLAVRGFKKSQVFYYTVSEALEQDSTVKQQPIRVNGMVVSGSIDYVAEKLMLTFDISDGKNMVPVVFHGAKPDLLTDDKEVVVEGSLDSDGVFKATKIITKCPSKYQSR